MCCRLYFQWRYYMQCNRNSLILLSVAAILLSGCTDMLLVSFTVASTSFAGPAAEKHPSSIMLNAVTYSCQTTNDEAQISSKCCPNAGEATDLPENCEQLPDTRDLNLKLTCSIRIAHRWLQFNSITCVPLIGNNWLYQRWFRVNTFYSHVNMPLLQDAGTSQKEHAAAKYIVEATCSHVPQNSP